MEMEIMEITTLLGLVIWSLWAFAFGGWARAFEKEHKVETFFLLISFLLFFFIIPFVIPTIYLFIQH